MSFRSLCRVAGIAPAWLLLAAAMTAQASTTSPETFSEEAPASTTLYVDASASGGGNGSSWFSAFRYLQDALSAARVNSAVTAIRVAEGVYYPDEGAGQTDNLLNASFELVDGVEIYGGYPAGGGARDLQAHVTILSGDILQDDVNDDGNFIAETPEDIYYGNSDHVVIGRYLSASTVVDGVTITAGHATPGGWGGGFLNVGIDSESGSNPTFRNVTFIGNFAGERGGAVYNNGLRGKASPLFENVVFASNWVANPSDGSFGGAVFNSGQQGESSPVFRHVTFINNSTRHGGYEGSYGRGGAVYNSVAYSGESSPVFEHVTFQNNTALSGGGAMYSSAYEGGSSSPRLTNVTFSGNQTNEKGGALFNDGYGGTSSPVLENVTFSGNYGSSGGAIYNQAIRGASSPQMEHVTFKGNAAQIGGAMSSFANAGTSRPVVRSSIFWGNTAYTARPNLDNFGGVPQISHSIVQGSGGSGGWNADFGSDLGGNLDVDPRLESLQTNGGAVATMRPAAGSPAIDAASCAGTADARGRARPHDAYDPIYPDAAEGCDIGAVEVQVDELPVVAEVFVDASATGAGHGLSWSDAFPSLQDALAAARAFRSIVAVRVAEGVYVPDVGNGLADGDRGLSFNLVSGVSLYGGYPAGGGARDADAHRTVLSGDLGGDDEDAGGNAVAEAADEVRGANSFHVVTGTRLDATTRLDGVTVTAGQATGSGADGLGGGFYHDGRSGASTPTLIDVTFSGNAATSGGALYNDGRHGGAAHPVLERVTFVGNAASQHGGAAYNDGRGGVSSPQFVNATFEGNAAGRGGALYNDGRDGGASSPSLVYATLSGNTAGVEGGALYGVGAGVPVIRGSILWGNAAGSGAEVAGSGAAPHVSTSIVRGSGGSAAWDPAFGTDGGGNLDADPLLRALEHRGGAVATMLPAAGSAAVDADACTEAPSTDARGAARPYDGGCDLGAVEAQEGELTPVTALYVDASAAPGRNGLGWGQAFRHLQDALAAARENAATETIYVAEGVYFPDEGADIEDDDPLATFDLVSGVVVLGGYPQGGGSRNVATYRTVLSGDIGQDDLDLDGNAVAETADDHLGTNAYHVVSGLNLAATTALSGFTITAGHAPSLWISPRFHGGGGGIYLMATDFSEAQGIGSRPLLEDLMIVGNHAESSGGGIYNRSEWGEHGSPILQNVTLLGNSAGHSGGGMTSTPQGGTCSPVLRNVTFAHNVVDENDGYYGGGLYTTLSVGGVSRPELYHVTFVGNRAPSGGAMYNSGSQGTSEMVLHNSIVWGNTGTSNRRQITNQFGATILVGHSVVGGSGGSGGWNGQAGTDGGGNVDADPRLGPVRDNGGPVWTMLPWDGSPALDAASCLDDLAVDARDLPRLANADGGDAGCDIGALELQPGELATPHVVTGALTALDGGAASDVPVLLHREGLAPLHTLTGADGRFSFGQVAGEASYVVEPGDEARRFVPARLHLSPLLRDEHLVFQQTEAPVAIEVEVTATAEARPGEDTTADLAGGGTLTLPGGAVMTETPVQVGTFLSTPPDVPVTGTLLFLGPTGMTFAEPVTLRLPVPNPLPDGAAGAEDLRVVRYDEVLGTFEVLPTTVEGGFLVAQTGRFSGYGIGTAEALPVELASFEGVRDGEAVVLRWTTAGERGNAGFEVQRAEGEAWRALGFVEGAGTTTEAQAYRYEVAGLLPGTHRFRLRQLDHDGTESYGEEVEVAVGLTDAFLLSAPYPNPSAHAVRLELAVREAQRVRVALYDALGRRVRLVLDGALPAAETQPLVLDVRALPSGLYVLRAEGEAFHDTRTLTVVR